MQGESKSKHICAHKNCNFTFYHCNTECWITKWDCPFLLHRGFIISPILLTFNMPWGCKRERREKDVALVSRKGFCFLNHISLCSRSLSLPLSLIRMTSAIPSCEMCQDRMSICQNTSVPADDSLMDADMQERERQTKREGDGQGMAGKSGGWFEWVGSRTHLLRPPASLNPVSPPSLWGVNAKVLHTASSSLSLSILIVHGYKHTNELHNRARTRREMEMNAAAENTIK